MKSYTIKYFDFFGYDTSDFIPCEVTGKKAVDIMHIWPKGKYPELMDDIFNLAAGTRETHIKFENDKEKLLEIHLDFMLKNQPKKILALLHELTPEHTLFNQINEALIRINEQSDRI